MLGGALNTIIELPEECGQGPYARVAGLELAPNQDDIPAEHRSSKPENESLYRLLFDYEFHRIPQSNGPIHMTIGTVTVTAMNPYAQYYRRCSDNRRLLVRMFACTGFAAYSLILQQG